MPVLLPVSSPWTVRAERVDAGRVARLSVPGSRWALLADLHVSADPDAHYDGRRPLDNGARAAAEIAAARVDGVLVNGDLAWAQGEAGDYERLAEALASLADAVPVILAPGNHDRRDRLLARFHPEALVLGEPAKLLSVIDTPPARLILLDSLYRTDVVPGLLGQAQRQWLASTLDGAPERPTLLFVHHPLGEDDGALLDAPRLLDIARPRTQVKAILTAHDHVWSVEEQDGLHVVKLPAAAFPFLPSEPIGWVEAELREDGARLRLRAERGGEERVLHWRR